jgi:hypothetical protein
VVGALVDHHSLECYAARTRTFLGYERCSCTSNAQPRSQDHLQEPCHSPSHFTEISTTRQDGFDSFDGWCINEISERCDVAYR